MILKNLLISFLLGAFSFTALADRGEPKEWDGYEVVKQAYFLKDAAFKFERVARKDKNLTAELYELTKKQKADAKAFLNFVHYNNKDASQSVSYFHRVHMTFHDVRDGFKDYGSDDYMDLVEEVHKFMHELHAYYH